MIRYAWRGLLAHRTRLVLTAVAIVLGVALVSGTLILARSAAAGIDPDLARPARGLSVVVAGSAGVSDGQVAELFEVGQLPPVPGDLAERLAGVAGVGSATAAHYGQAQLVGRDGRVVAGDRNPVGRSVDVSFADRLVSGRLPTGPGEVAVDETTARDERLAPGDPTWVATPGAELTPVTVVGVLDVASEFPETILVGFDPATAARLLSRPGEASAIELRARPGVSDVELRDRVAAAAGPGLGVYTAARLAALRAERAREVSDLIGQIGTVASVVALFVGTFVIRNTYTIVLASRTRELALLRCFGASRRQLRRAALLEASVVGALAAAVGIPVGVGAAWAFGSVLPFEATPRLLASTVLIGLAVGVGTAVLSAWGPARRATRVPPVTALRADVYGLDRRSTRVRAAAGFVLLAAGAALVLVGTLGEPVRDRLIWSGAIPTIAGVFVLGPAFSRPLTRLLGAPLRAVPGRLARANAVRSPRRTSATILPLVVGLSLTGFLATLLAGVNASTVGSFDRTVRADFRLEPVGNPDHPVFRPAMSPTLAQRLAAVPELETVAAVQATDATVAAGTDAPVVAADPRALTQAIALDVTGGSLADLGPGAVAVNRRLAERVGAEIGAKLTVNMSRRTEEFTVRAIYDTSAVTVFVSDILPPMDGVLMAPADYARLGGEPGLSRLYATVRSGVNQVGARQAIDRVLSGYPNIQVLDRAELRHGVATELDPAKRFYYGLFGLMTVIALLGVVNTLALSVLERTRELALLRALGMDRERVRSMVRWEAAIMAAIGSAVGLIVGAFIGWAGTAALDMPVATVPVAQLLLVAAAAVVAGTLAATPPARRASRVDVLRALATD